jgi:hypothetical protein
MTHENTFFFVNLGLISLCAAILFFDARGISKQGYTVGSALTWAIAVVIPGVLISQFLAVFIVAAYLIRRKQMLSRYPESATELKLTLSPQIGWALVVIVTVGLFVSAGIKQVMLDEEVVRELAVSNPPVSATQERSGSKGQSSEESSDTTQVSPSLDQSIADATWSKGWAQGVTEYLLQKDDADQYLLVSCPDDPSSAVDISLGNKDRNNAILESITIADYEINVEQFLSDCQDCFEGYKSLWGALRTANTISIKSDRQEVVTFDVTNGREVLPETACQHSFEIAD